jgi:cytochrome c oxidase assembly protein subunit 15
MVVVGGITRLTESGLSITEWTGRGAIPPLGRPTGPVPSTSTRQPRNIGDQRPRGHDPRRFKQIGFWEWLHRLLGRLIRLPSRFRSPGSP